VYVVAAVDCGAETALCEKQEVRETPLLRSYPPFPTPALEFEGDYTEKALNGFLARFVPLRSVIELNTENHDAFIRDKPSVPKVILFTNKAKGIPVLFKAVSNNLEGKMYFAIARSNEDADIAERYSVSTWPKLLMVKASEDAPEVYKGELAYKPIFNWLNIHTETFVAGGEAASVASKSWMAEIVPELHRLSADDICLKTDDL
jgi:hypothetical protein